MSVLGIDVDIEFPYGRPERGDRQVVIFCHNQEHRRMVVRAFYVPGARYGLRSANYKGMRIDKAIVFAPSVISYTEAGSFERWMYELRSRMTPNAEEIIII